MTFLLLFIFQSYRFLSAGCNVFIGISWQLISMLSMFPCSFSQLYKNFSNGSIMFSLISPSQVGIYLFLTSCRTIKEDMWVLMQRYNPIFPPKCKLDPVTPCWPFDTSRNKTRSILRVSSREENVNIDNLFNISYCYHDIWTYSCLGTNVLWICQIRSDRVPDAHG